MSSDQIIMFLAGVWMTATGFGTHESSHQQDWRKRIIRHFRWMGPLLIAISVILFFAA